jgi:hypothetical protein
MNKTTSTGEKGQHKHGKNTLRLAPPMHPAATFWRESKLDHIDHI